MYSEMKNELIVPGLDRAAESGRLNAIETRRGQELMKKGLNYFHEALADYLLINPGATLREIGGHFAYTPAWICTVINSDMFKGYLAGRRADIRITVAESLPQKLEAAAHLATERVIEILESAEDSDTVLDAFDKIMHRAGYAPNAKGAQQPQGPQMQQNNVFFINQGDLAAAREVLVNAHVERVVEQLPEGRINGAIPVPAT